MKYDQLSIEINSEPELAIFLHIEQLTKEYSRIVTSSFNDDVENKQALDLIIVKINQCRETLNWVKEIY
tara:strand:+ start:1813 stop:2019 length:207 start_codon:yes stop_codon:yes gene_type:complete